jgi:16S rRNA (guanine966-N2)-methyltransferase
LRSGNRVSVRVIAGTLKGRRLKTPSWVGLRPTSDKLRETLFNILAGRIRGARVLDGYSGTGALGIEALSRGAAWVTFIDRDRRAQALIAENLALCGIENVYAIMPTTVAGALDALSESPAAKPFGAKFLGTKLFDDARLFDAKLFDVVLLDPPYAPESRDDLAPILTAAGRLIAPNGVLVLERARRHPVPEAAGRLVCSREVVSGDSALAFYHVLDA